MLTRDELQYRRQWMILGGWRGWVSPEGERLSDDLTDDDDLPHAETAADILSDRYSLQFDRDSANNGAEEELERRGWVRVVGDGCYSVYSVVQARDSLIELIRPLSPYAKVEVEVQIGPCFQTFADDMLDRLGVEG